jgi:hypothetical protein
MSSPFIGDFVGSAVVPAAAFGVPPNPFPVKPGFLNRSNRQCSHFPVRSADFQSAFTVIASAKPAASRRSRMLAFCAVHGISGLQIATFSRPGCGGLPEDRFSRNQAKTARHQQII